MRRDIVHEGAKNLTYEIREIVAVAHEIESMGMEITWENIGDPIQKGEELVPWIRDILRDLLDCPASYGYCDTAGVPETRRFLAGNVNDRDGGVQITPDDILFFNGIGDAVARVYGFLKREARVLGPSPAYSTHSSAEGAHSGYNHVTYQLDPHNGWMPDVEDIKNRVKYNDSIAGILLLTPDNPTGAVYPRDLLEKIVNIAREHSLFIIADEIYAHIVYPGRPAMHMSQWIEDVPAIAMRGISKEYPWPGARCGWLEILNKDRDENFATYVESLLAAKRLEVCSTTLPQMSIPRVFGDPRYRAHLDRRANMFSDRALEAQKTFDDCDAVIANIPGGAFYFTIMFKDGRLTNNQTLPIDTPKLSKRIEELVQGVSPDKRFVYYLMAMTGIVVVPLSGFQCDHEGFRFTLLENDDTKRAWIFKTLREAIDLYLTS
jgi:aspartate/methionine/tyrosine aminotransferase